MEKVWKFTAIEDGRAGPSYALSHADAVRAIDWVARGGRIEDLIRVEQPVEIGGRRGPKPSEVRVAA